MKRVLKVTADYGLDLKFKKCKFLKKITEIIGYMFKNGSKQPSETKTSAVRKFSQSRTVKDLESYLRLTTYFCKFIQDYAQTDKPLRKGVAFKFGPEQIVAFEKIKETLLQKMLLHLVKH